MRKTIILSFMIASATSLFAQSLTEKIEVSLVNVDVTVTSHGAPARGLSRDDFEVLEDGVPQTVTHFYAIENARDRSAPTPAAASASAAQPGPSDERFRRKVLVIIDNRHLSYHNRDAALQKLERFINDRFDSGSYDWSIAMIGERAQLLLPLTSDKEKIHNALAAIRNEIAGRPMRDTFHIENRLAPLTREALSRETMSPASGGNAPLQGLIEQANRFQTAADAGTTYLSVREVARSFANASGRKLILLMTGPFFDDENALVSLDPALSSRYGASIAKVKDQLVREANASNVSVSVVNVEGITPNNLGADMGHLDIDASHFDSIEPGIATTTGSSIGSMFWVARQTGGQAYNGNFVDRSLRDFDVDSANFYSLAYRPNHGDDRRYHTIAVRLKKPGSYRVTYRNGYSSLPIDLQLQRAMTSAMAAEMQPSSIPLNVTTGNAAAAGARDAVLVPIYAAVSAKELQFLPAAEGSVARVDFFLSIFSESGHLIRAFRTLREARATAGTEADGNFIEKRSLQLRKGVPYRVVVAVHDQVSDAVGIKSQTVRF